MKKILLILPLLGCPSTKDCTCEDDDTAHQDAHDTAPDPNDTVDSCVAPDFGTCYQYDGYTDTLDWCESIGATYMVTTSYSRDACAPGAVLGCLVPAGADGTEHEATVYYYSTVWDYETAAVACAASGGTAL